MTSYKGGFAVLVLAALSVIACGGDDDGDGSGSGNGGLGTVCEQACAKIEDCSPGSVCTINTNGGACDGKAAEVSQCILDKPCGQTNACFF